MASQAPVRTVVSAASEPPLAVDSTEGSIPHYLSRYYISGVVKRAPSGAKVYVWAILITYLPMLIAALFSPLPLASRNQTVYLPFLLDWNVAFMFLVSFPTLVALTVTDQHVLAMALDQVQNDGILVVPAGRRASVSSEWMRKFRLINIRAQLLGILTGIAVATGNYIAYRPASIHFWIAENGKLLPVGVAMLWSIFLFYALLPLYFFRSLWISFFLKDVVGKAQLHMLPFHPDRSGGLRPVGHLGVRNQYALSVFGINVVLLVTITKRYIGLSPWLYGLIVAAAVTYVLLGPFVFLGPLLPFRSGMLHTKNELMSEVAKRLRVELDHLRGKLPSEPITKDDEELIGRLRKIGEVIEELPVWPFDAATLRKFLTAYVLPLLGTAGYQLLKSALPSLLK